MSFDGAATQTAFTEYCLAVKSADERVQRLGQALLASVKGWRFEPVVQALQALRGVAAVTAVGLVCEIGDLERFEHPRPLLTEAAWNYRFTPRIGKDMQVHQEGLSEAVRTMAWKAQLRLTQRFKALRGRGVQANKACIAAARELAGFIWAITRRAQAEQTR